jgi:hypothetical protein
MVALCPSAVIIALRLLTCHPVPIAVEVVHIRTHHAHWTADIGRTIPTPTGTINITDS